MGCMYGLDTCMFMQSVWSASGRKLTHAKYVHSVRGASNVVLTSGGGGGGGGG